LGGDEPEDFDGDVVGWGGYAARMAFGNVVSGGSHEVARRLFAIKEVDGL